MKRNAIIAWLVLVHLAAGYLLYAHFASSVFSQRADARPPAHYRYLLRAHSTIDPFVADGAVVFIGDSITEGLNVSAVAENSVNYGISNDTTTGVLNRLGLYGSLQRASLVVLAIGVNDLVSRPVDAVLDDYARILAALPTGMSLLLSAPLPVDETAGWDGLNAKITAFNRGLPSLAEKYDNARLIDVGARLGDASGNLDKSLYSDGVHLNEAGYRVWIEALRQAISEMQVTNSEG